MRPVSVADGEGQHEEQANYSELGRRQYILQFYRDTQPEYVHDRKSRDQSDADQLWRTQA